MRPLSDPELELVVASVLYVLEPRVWERRLLDALAVMPQGHGLFGLARQAASTVARGGVDRSGLSDCLAGLARERLGPPPAAQQARPSWPDRADLV